MASRKEEEEEYSAVHDTARNGDLGHVMLRVVGGNPVDANSDWHAYEVRQSGSIGVLLYKLRAKGTRVHIDAPGPVLWASDPVAWQVAAAVLLFHAVRETGEASDAAVQRATAAWEQWVLSSAAMILPPSRLARGRGTVALNEVTRWKVHDCVAQFSKVLQSYSDGKIKSFNRCPIFEIRSPLFAEGAEKGGDAAFAWVSSAHQAVNACAMSDVPTTAGRIKFPIARDPSTGSATTAHVPHGSPVKTLAQAVVTFAAKLIVLVDQMGYSLLKPTARMEKLLVPRDSWDAHLDALYKGGPIFKKRTPLPYNAMQAAALKYMLNACYSQVHGIPLDQKDAVFCAVVKDFQEITWPGNVVRRAPSANALEKTHFFKRNDWCDLMVEVTYPPRNSASHTAIVLGTVPVAGRSIPVVGKMFYNYALEGLFYTNLLTEVFVYREIVQRLTRRNTRFAAAASLDIRATPHLVEFLEFQRYRSPLVLPNQTPGAKALSRALSAITNASGSGGKADAPQNHYHVMWTRRRGATALSKFILDKTTTASEVKDAVLQVLHVIACLADVGISHTDLHCGNVLVEKTAVPTKDTYVFRDPQTGQCSRFRLGRGDGSRVRVYVYDWDRATLSERYTREGILHHLYTPGMACAPIQPACSRFDLLADPRTFLWSVHGHIAKAMLDDTYSTRYSALVDDFLGLLSAHGSRSGSRSGSSHLRAPPLLDPDDWDFVMGDSDDLARLMRTNMEKPYGVTKPEPYPTKTHPMNSLRADPSQALDWFLSKWGTGVTKCTPADLCRDAVQGDGTPYAIVPSIQYAMRISAAEAEDVAAVAQKRRSRSSPSFDEHDVGTWRTLANPYGRVHVQERAQAQAQSSPPPHSLRVRIPKQQRRAEQQQKLLPAPPSSSPLRHAVVIPDDDDDVPIAALKKTKKPTAAAAGRQPPSLRRSARLANRADKVVSPPTKPSAAKRKPRPIR